MATFFFWVNLSLFFSKKKRVGFMYTFFAITLVASLAFLVAVQSNNLETSKLAEKIKSDEVFYFMRGVDADLIRAGEISGRRAKLLLWTATKNASDATKVIAKNVYMNPTLFFFEKKRLRFTQKKNVAIVHQL